MDILRFTLSGKTAFFKKPEVNTFYYFSYGNIHKVALLGMFGAILGYAGYNQMKPKNGRSKKAVEKGYPEFYRELKNVKVSILPKRKKGFIPKKIQTFNNSVGYASKEQGGNLIIKEQWLENPEWDICVLIDNEKSRLLAESILQHKCVYVPYLGKNDHCADISFLSLEPAVKKEFKRGRIHCLFPQNTADFAVLSEDEELELEMEPTYKY